jgi:hypothetical protein
MSYFIVVHLVIEVMNNKNNKCSIKLLTNRKVHLFEPSYIIENTNIQKLIDQKYNKKLIYKDDNWTKNNYKKKYRQYISDVSHNISKILLIYKETKLMEYS